MTSGVVTEVVAASAVVLTPLLAVTRPVNWLVPVTLRLPPKLPLPEAVSVVVWVPPLARSRPAMVTSLLKVAALVTNSVLLIVVAPVTVSAPPISASLLARKEPTTSKVRPGVVVPIPTRPVEVTRSRSLPAVLRVMVPLPLVEFSASVPPLLTEGVATPPLAVSRLVTVTVSLKVAAPRARRLPSTSSRAVGATVLMPTKPALAPAPRMRMRSMLAVRNARSCASKVPTKLVAGLVPVLPVSAQALAPTNVAVETCDSRPVSAETTTRSRPSRLVPAVPPRDLSATVPFAAIVTWSVSVSPTKFCTRKSGVACEEGPCTSSEPPRREPICARPVETSAPVTLSGPTVRSPAAPRMARTLPLVARRKSLLSLVPI